MEAQVCDRAAWISGKTSPAACASVEKCPPGDDHRWQAVQPQDLEGKLVDGHPKKFKLQPMYLPAASDEEGFRAIRSIVWKVHSDESSCATHIQIELTTFPWSGIVFRPPFKGCPSGPIDGQGIYQLRSSHTSPMYTSIRQRPRELALPL